ncbi:hypothetical protein ACFQY7_19545 [Actinomadura luteofluorescens]|uniref:hypothetical protein n=1 Tax=Actinomadura luteofluorescens TaxID=46163 RepID=UPI0036427BA9
MYFGVFFCMNGFWPRSTRLTDSGALDLRDQAAGDGVQVVDQVAFRRVRPLEQGLVEVRQPNPVTLFIGAHPTSFARGPDIAVE